MGWKQSRARQPGNLFSRLGFYGLAPLCLFFGLGASAHDYNITCYGAVGDGVRMNTGNIQSAIDKCALDGGGRVVVPQGRFLTGSLYLKSGVVLFLEKNAILLGSEERSDYKKKSSYALILAVAQHNIGIGGSGTIDGQGRQLAANVEKAWNAGLLPDNKGKNRPDEKYRPMIIDLEDCHKVTVSSVTIKDASCWVETYIRCQGLRIRNIKVSSTAYWNNDGMDIVDCTDTEVSGCDINSADDGICLKSGDSARLCENVSIKNCRIRSSASAIKFGTASTGGFKNIRIKNIYVYDTYRSAIALECVDGGILEDIFIKNIKADNTGNAIFIRLGKRNANNRISKIENVKIENLTAFIPDAKPDKGYEMEGPVDKEPYNTLPSSIVGLRGDDITGITLAHLKITYAGGATKSYGTGQVPERPANYPEFSMFGELPAWGFYLRHVSGIIFKDVTLTCGKPDYRPGIVKDDAKDVKEDGVYVNGVGGK